MVQHHLFKPVFYEAVHRVMRGVALNVPCRCGWPRQSVKAMQMWAKDQGADPGPIDGCWGRRTSKAMQIALNSLRGKEGSTSMPVKVEPSAVLHAFSASNDKEPLVAAGVPLLLGVPAPKAASAA